MDKYTAIETLVSDWKRDRPSRARYQRTHRALLALGLSQPELTRAEHLLEYRNDSGELYPRYRTEKKGRP